MIYRMPCGYYPQRLARNHCFEDPHHALTDAQRTRLLGKGYRRFATDYYRPFCERCHECIPYRVLVGEFEPDRSMRRVRKRNADVVAEWHVPQPTREKLELYVRYQLHRHKENTSHSQAAYHQLGRTMLQQMYTNPPSTLELTTRENGRLLGFAIFDRTLDSLSAVYSVYEPEHEARSLGTLNILLAIEKAKGEGLPYLNLGLWLAHHPKMAYKSRFRPAEIYTDFRWRRID